MRLLILFAVLAVFTIPACTKKQGCTEMAAVNYDSNAQIDNGSCVYQGVYQNGVFILNEGNFQFGNASMSFYNHLNESVQNRMFEAINGIPMGDVAQSMMVINDAAYVVMNNSGKIWKLDLSNLNIQAEITGFPSPRYMIPVSESKAYVSNFQGDVISVFNLLSNAVTGEIAVDGWTEEMEIIDNNVYALGMRSNQVYKINAESDQITDSLYLGIEPYCIEKDEDGKLWVLTTGGLAQEEFPKLSQINPETFSVENEFPFPRIDDYPSNLTFSPDYQSLYFTAGNGLYKMDVQSGQIPNSPIAIGSFYGMNIDPESGIIYVTDALDYNQRGYVYRLTESGSPIDTFKVDLIPRFMLFTSL